MSSSASLPRMSQRKLRSVCSDKLGVFVILLTAGPATWFLNWENRRPRWAMELIAEAFVTI